MGFSEEGFWGLGFLRVWGFMGLGLKKVEALEGFVRAGFG